ncbi:YtxH domain-containing protein [Piscinibacter terrae]|uniref:YtxH domain-containing protein n=1 Tax=Piscinibacter terrae TaxID=2496871 RepID=A0A3N7K122_9BURK|nr:YtxH domain-containing protein [Albitalea terrae]RQP26699.1 YtxH domain-containing protein [Albitalea terrae]
MRFAPELIAVIVGAVGLLAGLLWLRAKGKRTRNVGRPVSDGPANLRYSCAGCSQQFTHSRRTLAAWKRGDRRFYCNACHTKSRGSRRA